MKDTYKIAYDLLSEKINFFYIFPSYFIELAKRNNVTIEESLDNNTINELISLYNDSIYSLEEKAKALSNIVDCNDPLGFFQELMMMKAFGILEKTNLSDIKKMNKDDVINLLAITNETLEKILNKYM